MSDQIITYTAAPPVTRWVYVKTAIIMFIVTEIGSFFAQMKLVQQLELKYSSIIAGILSLIIIYFLTRSPLTQSLTVDYARQIVSVGYATLTKASNTLEIPFARLGVETETTSAPNSPDPRWKTNLLLDGQKVYLILSSETGFTPEQLNDFNERAKASQAKN